MENVFYLTVIIIGFIISFISLLIINKKYKILSIINILYSYILFIIVFIFFSKLISLITDFNLDNINNLLLNDIFNKLKFIFSGYSFIGGYIGVLLLVMFLSKLFNKSRLDIMTLYIPSMLITYSILKIGCYIKGCCYGIHNFPIQLIEVIINLIAYIFILILVYKNNKKYKIVGLSLILFGVLRFIISIFRMFNNIYTFIFIEIFCLFLIFFGILIIYKFYKKLNNN